MRVFRLEREKYLDTTLSGTGAARSEGFRWNSLNTYLVYTSAHASLAILEVSVHLDLSEDLPTDRYLVEIDIPDEITISIIDPSDLPPQWDSKPPGLATQYIGDDFTQQNLFPVLRVPSCIVPIEYNFLINPNHPDIERITVVNTDPFTFDPRIRG